MNSEEIDKRLKKGELLFCSECDLFFSESKTCKIIICSNPFLGPSDLDIEDHMNQLENNIKQVEKSGI